MRPRAARLGVDIFTGLVIVSIAVALAGLTWRLLGDPGRRFGSAPVAARVARPVDIAPVIAAAPFGAGAAVTAQSTDQTLVLRGILLAEPRAASTALIQVGGAPVAAFAIGQAVGGSTIDAIALDHVVLRTGGGQAMLAFPTPAGGTATVQPVASASAPAASGAAPPPAAPPAGTAIDGLVQGLGGTATAEGYRVGAQPEGAARLAGVQAGDVIERINGRPAAEAMRDRAGLAQAALLGSARIEINRGGQRLTLVVPLR